VKEWSGRSSAAVVSTKIGGKRDTGIGNFEFVQAVTPRQVGRCNSCNVEPTNPSGIRYRLLRK